MSISSPLPSVALSAHQLAVSLALDEYTGPAPLSSSSVGSGGPSSSAITHDIFDDLDLASDSWAVVDSDEIHNEPRQRKSQQDATSFDQSGRPSPLSERRPGPNRSDTALVDRDELSGPRDGTQRTRLLDGEDCRAWTRETSARIMAMAAGRVRRQDTARPKRPRAAIGAGQARDESMEQRIAVGCEDGTLWIFAPRATPSIPAQEGLGDVETGSSSPRISNHQAKCTPGRASIDLLSSSAPSSPPPHSPLHSPPLSPPSRPWTPALGTSSRLSISQRSSSSTSLASTATSATARSKRIASASSSTGMSGSGGNHALASYELVHSHSRPRKASATVSISTSSYTPSPHAHSHGSHSESAHSPPLPPSPSTSSPSATVPTSPPPPHLIVSSPSRPSSTASGSLQSRKEARASGTTTPNPQKGSRSTHSRTKGSIATGLGLWQVSSAAPSPQEERPDPTKALDDLQRAQVDASEIHSEAAQSRLRPIVRVLVVGKGPVVAVETVDVAPFCTGQDELGDAAVLVLRQSGHLSVVSLVDGNVFGSCDVGCKVASTSRAERSEFSTIRIAKVGESQMAICVGTPGTKALVAADLGSLLAQDAIDFDGSPECLAVLEPMGEPPVLVYPSSPAQGEPFHLLARSLSDRTGTGDTSSISLGVLSGSEVKPRGLAARGNTLVVYEETSLTILRFEEGKLQLQKRLDLPDVLEVQVLDGGGRIVVRTTSEIRVYNTLRNDAGQSEWTVIVRCGGSDVEAFACVDDDLLSARSHQDGSRSLQLLPIERCTSSLSQPVELLNNAAVQVYRSAVPAAQARVTLVKRLSSGEVLLGYNNGGIALVPLGELPYMAVLPPAKATLNGAITLLETVEFGGRLVIVAGSSSGAAGVWNVSDWDILGQWQLFASPVKHFAYFQTSLASAGSRLSNSIAFISANSPVALVSVFPPTVLFTLPGTKSSVELLATTKDEILVLYEQGLARTCDIKSRELRRSMDRKTAQGVLQDEAWTVWFRLSDAKVSPPSHPVLAVELRDFLDEAARDLPWSTSRMDQPEQEDTPRGSPDAALGSGAADSTSLAAARGLAAVLTNFGLDAGADELLAQLGVFPPEGPLAVGLDSADGVAFSAVDSPRAPWQVSSRASAHRLMQLICVLRVFLNYPETERVASEAVVYFASCLADTVGPSFCPPSLDVLAQFWLDRNSEVQQAAKSLFGTYLAAMPDDEIVALVEGWQNQLPSRQNGDGLQHSRADHALLIIGLIAIERYKLLSTSVLVDVAKSVSAYLDEGAHPYHQAVAAELCSRGFAIWQNYVDAMSLVRALFALAIGRNPSTPSDLRVLARNATLHIAGINTPLFMTTLLHDILNAATASARNATLKLLGFMIRKKPLVLYTNLPRVAEAVVKSLDPTISALRETVQQSATVILNELVRRFPSIDFHGKSQRLAVGTAEGAAIVFDLRSATRLYVLEGHSRPVTALSWSPDGHRLVTVSLEENRVVVWRVSGGILGMFMAGTPARQGSSGQATPFKTYDFHVGDEALMSTAATLEWVVMEWPADRTVRLRIRETALNFGV